MRKKIIAFLFFSSLFVFLPLFTRAEVSVWPIVIDAEAKPRDLLEYSITIKNSGQTIARLYPIIRDISENGDQDEANSLAGWIEIPRGRIELLPGEEKEIPFSVHIHLNAAAGKYYASLCFARGSTRPEAEANALKFNEAQTLLNIEVREHIIERAQINKFVPQRNLFLGFPIKFNVEIENTGNQEITSQGAIHIYNRKGEELKSIELNKAVISPQAVNIFNPVWQINRGFGRYKAYLLVEYGSSGKRTLQDTVYFWIFPFPWLILCLIILLFLIIVLFLIIFKKLRNYYPKNLPLKKVKYVKSKK